MRKQNIDITSAISVDVEANDKLKRPNSRSVCWQNFVCHQPCYRNVTAIVPEIDRALLNRALCDARKRFRATRSSNQPKGSGEWRVVLVTGLKKASSRPSQQREQYNEAVLSQSCRSLDSSF